MLTNINEPVTQDIFASAVGVSRQRVQQLAAEGVLRSDGTFADWLLAYTGRLRDQVAARQDADLMRERIGLTRSQREAQDLRNQALHRQYAPVELLQAILRVASGALAQRLATGSTHFIAATEAKGLALTDDAKALIAELFADALKAWCQATQGLTLQDELQALDDETDEDHQDDDDNEDHP